MRVKTIVLFFVVAAFAITNAAETYKLTLFQPSYVPGTQLKAGDYKIEVDGDQVVFRQGRKSRAEAAVKVETNGEKYRSTSVRYDNGDGKYRIAEIRLGGTNTKLVIN